MRILYLPNQYSQQRQKEKKRWIYPVLLAMQAQHYRNLGHEVIWDKSCLSFDKIVTEPESINFLNLPRPDRIFTNAFDKKYQQNGNFKYKPGTYIQVANGCWHGKCSFCVEKNNMWRVRPVWDVMQELNSIKELGFKEVFDDSGSFPVGKWLEEFLSKKNPGLIMGCNMRAVDIDYERLKSWGFRMILFGIESANQKTLDNIHKGTKISDIRYIEKAAKAGLENHGAFMFGFPWESDKDAENTLKLAHELLRKGILKTAQASFYQPPERENNPSQKKFVRKLFHVAFYNDFWITKLKDLKNFNDVKYLFRQIKDGLLK